MELKDYYGFLLVTLIAILIFDNYVELTKTKSEEVKKHIQPMAFSNLVIGFIFLIFTVMIFSLSINLESTQ